MRIEGGSYLLPARGTGAAPRTEPQAIQKVFDTRQRRLPPPQRSATFHEDDTGFADALMNVQIGDRAIHRTALLFEVQRLAQGEAGVPEIADLATDATLAYRDALDRNALPRRRGALAGPAATLRV